MKKKAIVITLLAIVGAAAWSLFFNYSFRAAPFSLPAGPIFAYRITGEEIDSKLFREDANSFHGYAVVGQKMIADPKLAKDVVELLNSRTIYGLQGNLCFEPGIAIRFGDGKDAVDALICLECQHIYFYRGDTRETRNISPTGVARIKKLYARLFPGHDADIVDDDTARIAAIRKEAREKLLINAATAPAPAPK